MQHPGLHLRLIPAVREPFLSEFDGFEVNVAAVGQEVDRRIEGVSQRDEHSRTGHGLVALVLADRLRRHAVVDSSFEFAERKATGPSGHP